MRKHRVTLYAADGIEVYESGYYPGVDDPYLPIIAQVDFDPDEGDNGRAWIDYKKADEQE